MHLDCRGEGSSNRNASRDESVETGDESVEAGDESIEAGEKTQQSCYNIELTTHVWMICVFIFQQWEYTSYKQERIDVYV